MKSLFYFFKMMYMRRNMSKSQIEDMHNIINKQGFIRGMKTYDMIYRHEQEDEKHRKDILVRKYASGKFDYKSIIDEDFNPSIDEIKGFSVKTHLEKYGVSITLYDRIKGWHFMIVESPNLLTPRVFSTSKTYAQDTWVQAMNFYQAEYRQFQPEEVEEFEQRKKKPSNQVKKDKNVDISHVTRAMGYEDDNKQDNDSNDDDLDFLEDLF